MDVTVFRYSRSHTAVYLAGSAVLDLLSIIFANHTRNEPIYLVPAFFTCSTGAFAWLLLRPRQLLLDSEGFTVSGGYTWRATKVFWRDVDDFFISRSDRGGKVISFNFKAVPRDPIRIADYVPRPRRVGTISLGWDQSAEELVSELNKYRQRSPV